MKISELRLAVLISIAGFILYISTLLPGIDWDDGARAQLYSHHVRFSSVLKDHTSYSLIGHLFSRIPVGDRALRVNLSSAVYGAVGIFFFARLCFELLRITRSREILSGMPDAAGAEDGQVMQDAAATVVASGALALSQAFWFCSTHPRVLSLFAAALLAAIYLAVRSISRPRSNSRFALLFVLGFCCSLHVSALLIAPIVIFTVTSARSLPEMPVSKTRLIAGLCMFLIGASPFLLLLLRDIVRLKQPFLVPLLALGGARGDFGAGSMDGWIARFGQGVLLLGYNFMPWGIAAALIGGWIARAERRVLGLLVGGFVACFIFGLLYTADGGPLAFFPAWIFFSGFAVLGWRAMIRRIHGPWGWGALCVVMLAPPLAYGAVGRSFGPTGAAPPARQDLFEPYYLIPHRSPPDAARTYGQRLLKLLPPGARVVAYYRNESSSYFILKFFQLVESERRDLRVDDLRGFQGVIRLDHLFELEPADGVVYVPQLSRSYDTQNTRLERLGKASEISLHRVIWTGIPQRRSSLMRDDSNWKGRLSLANTGLGLRIFYENSFWYLRIRSGSLLFYPVETRVEGVSITPGLLSFDYSGMRFRGIIFPQSMLGQWWTIADPEMHGEWEVRLLGNFPEQSSAPKAEGPKSVKKPSHPIRQP